MKQAIPTLGYRSQAEAIIALYKQGVPPKVIADRTLVSANVVHRHLHVYRAKTKDVVAVNQEFRRPRDHLSAKEAHDSPYQRALAAHARAVEGARRTLRAMQ